jgi:hypothetical protein
MDESERVSIISSTGPGFTPEEPLALVVKSKPEDSFIDAASFIPGSSDMGKSFSGIHRPWKLGGRSSTTITTFKDPRYCKQGLSNLPSFH